jgi:hypothetical protein
MAVSLAGLASLGVSVTAQPVQPAPASLDSMRALSFLEGAWEGEGWIRMGPGEPTRFTSKETVESRLGGRILTVEGLHHASADPSRVVHHAFAVVSHNAAAARYRFQTHLADGRGGDYPGELKDGAFVWGMEHPMAGRIRYTIRVREGRWHEVGESSRDEGKTWTQFFEMTLARKK